MAGPNYPYKTYDIYDDNDNDKIKWRNDNSLFAVDLVYLLSFSPKSVRGI